MIRPTRWPRPAAAACVVAALAVRATAAPDLAPVSVATAPDAPEIASADQAPAGPRVVLESHLGHRRSDMSILLGPLLDELERKGFAAHPASIDAQLGGRAPRPGILDPGKTAADITQLVDSGFDAFTAGRYQTARTTLALAVGQLRRNPGLIATDTRNARAQLIAFAGLALSEVRLGDDAAGAETMTELIRVFGPQALIRGEFGPRAEELHRAALKHAEQLGRGRLAITTRDTRAMIFVDNALRGVGRLALDEVLPGSYRVFLLVPGSPGRQYEVAVRAGETSALDVDYELDARLTVSDVWAGFEFASVVEHALQARYAAALARRWKASCLVVVSASQIRGEPVITATMYASTGEIVRAGHVVPSGAWRAKLEALARYLADGAPSAEITVVSKPRPAPLAPRASQVARSGPAALVFGGVAALAAGVVIVGASDRRSLGVLTGLAGGAAIGGGLWLWPGDAPAATAPVISLVPAGAVVGWAGQF